MGDLKTAIAKVDDLAQSLGRGLTDVLLAFDSTNAAKKQQTRELLTKMREEVPVQLHQATAVIKAKTKQHHVPIPTQFSYGASPIIYCTPPTTPDNKASMPVSPNTTAKDKPVPKGAKKAALPAAVSRPKKPTLPAAAAAPKKPTLPAAPAPKKPTPAPAAAKVAPPPQTPSKKPRRTKSKRKLPKKETKVTILDEMAKAGFGDMAVIDLDEDDFTDTNMISSESSDEEPGPSHRSSRCLQFSDSSESEDLPHKRSSNRKRSLPKRYLNFTVGETDSDTDSE